MTIGKDISTIGTRLESMALVLPGRKQRMAPLRVFVSVPAALAVMLLTACAAQRSADVPPQLLYQTISEDAHPVFESVARKAADSRHVPARITFDSAEATLADFHLDLDFRVRSKDISMTEEVWQQTTTMLLTMYPATCGRYILELSGDLYDENGVRLESWHLEEQDTAFLWLFRGKDCGAEQSEESVRKIAANMLKRLYKQMAKDGVWSDRALIPLENSPLVYIAPVNARELVERVTKTDEPFQNFTFDSSAGMAANRTIKIQFYFNQTEQGWGSLIGRSTGAMMTLGLISMCPPNEMVINASVLDGNGTVLGDYRFAQKKRADGDMCYAPTDKSHPQLAAKLVRQLFEQIKKDKLIG